MTVEACDEMPGTAPYPPEVHGISSIRGKAHVELHEPMLGYASQLDEFRSLILQHDPVSNTFNYPNICREKFLLAFLRWAKFDVHRAFRRLKQYSTFRSKNIELFEGDLTNAKDFFLSGMLKVLSTRSAEGCYLIRAVIPC